MSSGFITEKEVADRRKARQEDWEKNRAEEDPEEAPEEEEAVYDPRSLYDRLQEQKTKKQEEYDEAHKFKNMVRGLEDDEVDFLELVDRSKLREESRVRTEETVALTEYRKKVAAMQKKNTAEEELRAEVKAGERKASGSRKPSHLSLLAGAIKRKANDDDEATHSKKSKSESTKDDNEEPTGSSSTTTTNSPPSSADPHPDPPQQVMTSSQPPKSGFQCIAVLPGLGVYTDSSDSENNGDTDSDSEEEVHRRPSHPQAPIHARDITGRIIKTVTQCGGGHAGC